VIEWGITIAGTAAFNYAPRRWCPIALEFGCMGIPKADHLGSLNWKGQTNSTASMIIWYYSFVVTWGLKWPNTCMRHWHPVCSSCTLTQNVVTGMLAHARTQLQYWLDVLLATQGDTQRIVRISNFTYEGTKCGHTWFKLFCWYQVFLTDVINWEHPGYWYGRWVKMTCYTVLPVKFVACLRNSHSTRQMCITWRKCKTIY